MVFVVLRSGRVLQYNRATHVSIEDGTVVLQRSDYLVARLPLDVVERVEFERPCRIRRQRRLPKRADY